MFLFLCFAVYLFFFFLPFFSYCCCYCCCCIDSFTSQMNVLMSFRPLAGSIHYVFCRYENCNFCHCVAIAIPVRLVSILFTFVLLLFNFHFCAAFVRLCDSKLWQRLPGFWCLGFLVAAVLPIVAGSTAMAMVQYFFPLLPLIVHFLAGWPFPTICVI